MELIDIFAMNVHLGLVQKEDQKIYKKLSSKNIFTEGKY